MQEAIASAELVLFDEERIIAQRQAIEDIEAGIPCRNEDVPHELDESLAQSFSIRQDFLLPGGRGRRY